MKKYILKVWPYLGIALIIGLVTATFEGLITISTMNLIDAAIQANNSLFISAGKKLLVLAIALLPLNILLSYAKGLYRSKALLSIKGGFIQGVFNKNINEFQKDNNAKYISSLTNDMNTIETNYIDGIFEIGLNIIYFIVGFIIIASINPYILIIGIVISGISAVISMLLGKPLEKHQSHRSQLFEGYTTYIKEVLGAFQIIKSNNLSSKIQKDFYTKSKDIQYRGYVIDKIHSYIMALQSFIINLSFFGLAGVAIYMSIKGHITLGGVVLVMNNMNKVIHPLMEFSEWLPKIISVKPLFKKLDHVLINQDNYVETLDIESFEDNIQFKDVAFSYDNNHVFKNVNLTIKKGEKCLIVGPSGGGKSTLLKLLRKYFTPSSGEILIDRKNLKDIRKNSYFSNISNVEQQVFLFEDTLKNNITLYKNYTEKEIGYAIEKAGLKDFVKGLTSGMDTVILDNGKNISGGEKSRIAIARGLLAKTDIIFLDEAFASLDSTVAKEIENTLLNLEGITVVNVSHVVFEETKHRYDKVFVVKNKKVLDTVYA